MKQRAGYILMSAVLLLGILLPLPANAIEVFVGYADNLRPTPFFPSPFFGDPSVALYAGTPPSVSGGLDSGAVRILNNTASNFVITSLDIKMRNGAGTDYNLWGSILGAGFTLAPGKDAIFVQTLGDPVYNFDSSDHDTLLGTGQSPLNNCSNGALAASATCVNNPPLVIINGGTPLKDTGHVLDTGGFDLVSANPCPNPLDSAPNCNESLQWRDIGTTGVGNPGGVPEPATLLLLASGLGGLFVLRYRKQI